MRVSAPLVLGTCACCSGYGSTTARGIGGHRHGQLSAGTCRCYSGHGSMAYTCIHAAMGGQLEILQWVRENDTTSEVWDERCVRLFAAGPRKLEVLTWLDQLSAP
jgi:hypothetical protein